MVFFKGFPNDSGASDHGDSASRAGLMAIVGDPKAPDLRLYVDNGIMRRLPIVDPRNPGTNNPRNFSRDQTLCLIAGLKAQGHTQTIKEIIARFEERKWRGQNDEIWHWGSAKVWPNARDFFLPSSRLAILKAAGLKPSFLLKALGNIQVLLEMFWVKMIGKDTEINQFIAILYMMGPSYLFLFKVICPEHDQHLSLYWNGWRNEPDLSAALGQLVRGEL